MLVAEAALVGSTMYLAYVTQFPYAVRRRHVRATQDLWVFVRVRCGHHWRWFCWQLTTITPAALRRRPTITDEE